MKVIDPLPSSLKVLNGADIYTHGYFPVAAAYCQKLDLINLVIEMVPSQMELKSGLIVQAMVLDTLSGRTPLYRLMDFWGCLAQIPTKGNRPLATYKFFETEVSLYKKTTKPVITSHYFPGDIFAVVVRSIIVPSKNVTFADFSKSSEPVIYSIIECTIK